MKWHLKWGKKVKDEQEEFENVFKRLILELRAASVHFYIWERLHITEETVDIISEYKGFFLPTRDAHNDRFISKVSDIMSKHPNAPSFYRVLNMIGGNPKLAPDVNVGEIKGRLEKHEEVLKAIKYLRNKRVDHWDTSVEKLSRKVLYGDAKRMLEDLKEICDEISSSHSGQMDAFRYIEQEDIIRLLWALKEKREL